MPISRSVPGAVQTWPALPLADWKPTCETLHMLTQIVGKVRMALTPPVNHFWHVTLYLTARGLTTSPIPYGARSFEIAFDFLAHNLLVITNAGDIAMLPLTARPVADFYRDLMSTLERLGIEVRINPLPQEVPNPIRFDEDKTHASYDPEYVTRFWRILAQTDLLLKEFRGRFVGKCSPVHFFWGSFDLAVTRFSGRRAPERVGADSITREAYSHECSSAGFWPGGATATGEYIDTPLFYSYSAPQPPGFAQRQVRPAAAHYDERMGEFVLLYDDVRTLDAPRDALLDFLQTSYQAGAETGLWDSASLEEPPSWPRGGRHAA